MSQASRIALATTSTFTCGMIAWVHFRQREEKNVCSALAICSPSSAISCSLLTNNYYTQVMHQGVVRDMERQRIKKERELDFDMQRQLEEEYKREQNVHNSLEPVSNNSAPPK